MIVAPVIVGLVVGTVVLLVPWMWRRAFPGPPNKTLLRYYSPIPFMQTGSIVKLAQGLSVTYRANAGCLLDGSLIDIAATDAYRCFTNSAILDPCWGTSDFGSTLLYCVATPWDKGVARLRVRTWTWFDASHGYRSHVWNVQKDPFGNSVPARAFRRHTFPVATTPPWALELTNGARCVFLSGVTGFVAAGRFNYQCGNKGWVVGVPNRQKDPWQVSWVPRGGATIDQIGVRVAWY